MEKNLGLPTGPNPAVTYDNATQIIKHYVTHAKQMWSDPKLRSGSQCSRFQKYLIGISVQNRLEKCVCNLEHSFLHLLGITRKQAP